jgi:hypothetical protein
MNAEEIQYDNDCLVITLDIVDCPMAEIPLTEVFNVRTGSVRKPQTRFVFIDTNTNFVFVFVSIFGSETTDTQTNTIDQ